MPAFQTLTTTISRHLHAAPYAAIVLEGAFEEAGESGRFRAEAGDVLVHCAFSAHHDRIDRRCVILNLELPDHGTGPSRRLNLRDLDQVVRIAATDPREAAAALQEGAVAAAACADDPVDLLAADLARPGSPSVAECASRLGRSRQALFRRFRGLYGVGPAHYRAEARARRAWSRIVEGDLPLAAVAAEEGFADQAHMTRALRALTGRTPGDWRRLTQHSFKTGGRPEV